jgi:hypothetical protein
MEGKKLINTLKYGNVTIERFVDESEFNRVCDINETDMGEVIIYEKTTKSPNPKYVKPIESKKENSVKPKKLQKLSKLGNGFESIMRQQLADRREITGDYSMSFEQWCREYYNVDAMV